MSLASEAAAVPLHTRALPGYALSIAMFIDGEMTEKEDRKEREYKWIIYAILC